jgi:hypothetical protein
MELKNSVSDLLGMVWKAGITELEWLTRSLFSGGKAFGALKF